VIQNIKNFFNRVFQNKEILEKHFFALVTSIPHTDENILQHNKPFIGCGAFYLLQLILRIAKFLDNFLP
jgi:hypothetical protein